MMVVDPGHGGDGGDGGDDGGGLRCEDDMVAAQLLVMVVMMVMW